MLNESELCIEKGDDHQLWNLTVLCQGEIGPNKDVKTVTTGRCALLSQTFGFNFSHLM